MHRRPRGSGFVGIMMQSPTLITYVAEDSPGEAAGLRVGDRIVRIDGHAVAHFQEYLNILWTKRPGDRTRLMLSRGPVAWTVDIVLGRHPRD